MLNEEEPHVEYVSAWPWWHAKLRQYKEGFTEKENGLKNVKLFICKAIKTDREQKGKGKKYEKGLTTKVIRYGKSSKREKDWKVKEGEKLMKKENK